MNPKKKKLFIVPLIIFSFLGIVGFSNYNSFQNAKKSCVEHNMTAQVEQDFLAINWSVICE
ncbi:hypothetical protein CSV61_16325 [Sporosarcina sp. P3]|uniref:hypothetical protein n=1 Tax=Sporosarcina TaxID=1569 RepID=UPI0009DC5CAC|nr:MULTISPECIES: hypothetical protein [Sporosarcina]ARF16132.1 hypothetical protein SporoP17a_01705 [Sporosarcina ureae]PID20118.1 hypothetical protein CSV61_16325 [Sporosarcina sp. P3]